MLPLTRKNRITPNQHVQPHIPTLKPTSTHPFTPIHTNSRAHSHIHVGRSNGSSALLCTSGLSSRHGRQQGRHTILRAFVILSSPPPAHVLQHWVEGLRCLHLRTAFEPTSAVARRLCRSDRRLYFRRQRARRFRAATGEQTPSFQTVHATPTTYLFFSPG